MTDHTLVRGRSRASLEVSPGRRAGQGQRVLISALAMIGVAILLFPTASNWVAGLDYHEQFGSSENAINALSAAEKARLLENAHEYNTRLPGDALVDPYGDDAEAEGPSEAEADYLSQLRIGGKAPMAWVEIPKIRTKLPIQHGTSDKTLEWSVGHLYGSSLPIGGESTHSVIVGHSGRPNARLFTDLERLRVGDQFITEVLGERLHYRVDSIEVVETLYFGDSLKPVAGKDYVTLMTCTPTGINTHRLLVRGERIPSPDETDSGQIRAEDYSPGFPWWAAAVLGAPVGTWFFLGAADRRRKKLPQG